MEILDKIAIDFNSVHPSNNRDEISFKLDGNSIVSKLSQFENDESPILVNIDFSSNDTFSKFEQ